MLFDGHSTHLSIDVISLAIKENIIIMKFPPHCTDVLQPLDVTCFGPLKRKWEDLLSKRMNLLGSKSTLDKSGFVNLVCSIWREGMNKENVISGFESTGI